MELDHCLRQLAADWELFDITDEQIELLEKSGQVQKHLIVYSPVNGHVMEKNAFPNMYITPETKIYTIADHTKIWAYADIYENEISYVRKGQPVVMSTVAYPRRGFPREISLMCIHTSTKKHAPCVRVWSFLIQT